MRTLIVDDEPAARARLRRLLAGYAQIEVVGEARNGEEALELIEQLGPKAAFIDIQMPVLSGIDVVASLPEPGPAVVFVTAFDQYAVQAFDTPAIDYLLKPVDPERLSRAVSRLMARVQEERPARQLPAPPTLLVADGRQRHLVRVSDICCIEAADNYVLLHCLDKRLMMRRTLSALLEDLGPAFMRIHRGAAVALSHVDRVTLHAAGDATVHMAARVDLNCSRQHRAALLERLSGVATRASQG